MRVHQQALLCSDMVLKPCPLLPHLSVYSNKYTKGMYTYPLHHPEHRIFLYKVEQWGLGSKSA